MTPKQLDAWRHNGLIGQAMMAQRNLITISGSPTVTNQTRLKAYFLSEEVRILVEELRAKRVDL